MTLLRRAARPMLATTFVAGGIDSLRDPASKVPMAEGFTPQLQRIPALSDYDTETLVRINGAVQAGAGTLFAMGRLPRLSAVALAASLVPTTAAAHRFWEMEGQQRSQQQVQFFKNLSILGGLLLATTDTEGQPGIGWRARHRAEHAGRKARHTADHAGAAAERKRRQVKRAARTAKREAKLAKKAARAVLPV